MVTLQFNRYNTSKETFYVGFDLENRVGHVCDYPDITAEIEDVVLFVDKEADKVVFFYDGHMYNVERDLSEPMTTEELLRTLEHDEDANYNDIELSFNQVMAANRCFGIELHSTMEKEGYTGYLVNTKLVDLLNDNVNYFSIDTNLEVHSKLSIVVRDIFDGYLGIKDYAAMDAAVVTYASALAKIAGIEKQGYVNVDRPVVLTFKETETNSVDSIIDETGNEIKAEFIINGDKADGFVNIRFNQSNDVVYSRNLEFDGSKIMFTIPGGRYDITYCQGYSPKDAQTLIDIELKYSDSINFTTCVPKIYTKSDLIGTIIAFRDKMMIEDEDGKTYQFGYSLNSVAKEMLFKDQITLVYDDGDSFKVVSLGDLIIDIWNKRVRMYEYK